MRNEKVPSGVYLSDKEKKQIYNLVDNGEWPQIVAKEFGVTRKCVMDVFKAESKKEEEDK